MRVITEKPLKEFAQKHANAATPLKEWTRLVRHGHFQHLTALKRTFPSVDLVPVKKRDFYVFEIGGDKYRLVAAIHFNTQLLFVRHVLTHAEYSTDTWKKRP